MDFSTSSLWYTVGKNPLKKSLSEVSLMLYSLKRTSAASKGPQQPLIGLNSLKLASKVSFFEYIQCDLTSFWPFFDHFFKLFFDHFYHFWTIFEPFFGPFLDYFWTILDHFWTTFEPFLDSFQIYFRSIQDSFGQFCPFLTSILDKLESPKMEPFFGDFCPLCSLQKK